MTEYAKLPDANIVALCDVNQAALERGQAQVEKATGKKPKGYDDMRKVFDDKNVTRFPCRCPITGTRWPPSGHARQAKTSTSRSRRATTPTKARRWSRPRGNTTAWCRSGRRAAAWSTRFMPCSCCTRA